MLPDPKEMTILVNLNKHIKTDILLLFLYTTITLLIFWPVLLNIQNTIPNTIGTTGDVNFFLWDLWWPSYSIFTLHSSPYITNFLYYPYGADFSYNYLDSPIASLISFPFQQISLTFSYNVIFILGFLLSAFFMYLLAMYLTENTYASFIAGVIFSFSAVHIAHSFIFLNFTSTEWIPLFILSFLLSIKRRKLRYIVLAAFSLVLASFMGDIEQGIMLFIFVLLFCYFTYFSSSRKLINLKTISIIFEILLLSFLIGLPFISPLINGIIHSNSLSLAATSSSIGANEAWSNDLLSFFLPSSFNGLFNQLASKYYPTLMPYGFYWEGVSYIGYSVILLSIFGLYSDIKSTKFKNTMVWASIGIIFAMLSLGPLVKIGGVITNIPGPYLIYHFIPILNLIREPGRFDIMFSLCLAILAAFGLKSLLSKVNSVKKKIICTATISSIILLECAGIPLTSSFINTFYKSTTIPKAYSLINHTVNSSVLFLPSAPDQSYQSAIAMYYQTEFNMPIIGGYTTRSTLLQDLYIYSIPLVSTYSLENLSDYGSYPIKENLTEPTLILLSKYNISYISVLSNLYDATVLKNLTSTLSNMLGSPIYAGNSTILFKVPDKIHTQQPPSNITAFISGEWAPESAVCSSNCLNESGFWWAANGSSISLYSPTNGLITMNSDILSLDNSTISIYNNGTLTSNQKVNVLSTKYTARIPVRSGYNNLTIIINNSSQDSFTLAFRNITFFKLSQN